MIKDGFVVIKLVLLLGLLFVGGLVQAKTEISSIRVWHSPDNTRVVFDVSADVKHKLFTLENPNRLVIDIEDITLTGKIPTLDQANKHIANIRTGQPKPTQLRFVFELKQTLKPSSFLLSPNELYGHRLVVDLLEDAPVELKPLADRQPSEKKEPSAKQEPSANKKPAVAASSPTPTLISQPAAIANKPLMIAIDAGHGGEDPGAIGHTGSYEKRVTLAIAKKLQAVIDADPRLQSRLVRSGDYFIKLHKRRQIAREIQADMFISIHADAFTKKSARGFSVFALSQRGATSAMARALAAKENAADLIGGVSLKDKDELLAKVLVDLSMTNTISESVNFGGRVLKELGKLGKLHSKRVEQAGFAVLKSPDIPSILVETGFITNPQEERNLNSSRYQQRIAQAIYKAINEYYQQTPYYANANYSAPDVTFSGSKSSGATSQSNVSRPRYHKVVRGDSLSKIAQKYRVSMRAIKKLNKLRTNTVMLGQRLKIPGGNTQVAKKTKTQPNKSVIHTVKRGDSLSKISAQYNVKIKWIKKANNLRKDTVFLGQKLRIPGQAEVSTEVNNKPRFHKVRRGDTLSEIAQKYNSSMRAIMQANKLRNKTVMLGQTLKIPN